MLIKILDNGFLIMAIFCWLMTIFLYLNKYDDIYLMIYINFGAVCYMSDYFEKKIRKVKNNK